MDNIGVSSNKDDDHDHDHDDDEVEVPLPGFRFHPTDEELVGFYLRRKVDNKPITLDLIKSIDIYKYDPWDLPKTSCTSGDKEWYFFCRRGRKYKNSIRPNRVTGSGFWKATGIDKPVNSHGGDHGKNNQCIGLKKTLVYYRGSAGKGTKTDWMMHEFRLPTANDNHISTTTNINHLNVANHKADPQEAEIWTLCRIFKRNVSYRRYTPDWREMATKRHPMDTLISSKKSSSLESNKNNIMTNREPNYNYIDFSAPASNYRDHEAEKKPDINHTFMNGSQLNVGQLSSVASQNFSNIPHFTDSISSVAPYPDESDQFFMHTSWDELSAVVELALDPAFV